MDIKVTEDISSEFVEIVRDILEDEEFRNGTYTTNLMEKRGWV